MIRSLRATPAKWILIHYWIPFRPREVDDTNRGIFSAIGSSIDQGHHILFTPVAIDIFLPLRVAKHDMVPYQKLYPNSDKL